MAHPASAPFDVLLQMKENCRFISQSSAQFAIITTREPLGGCRAVVVRTVGGKRDVFLSATGASFPEAFQELHSKSADATQNYISLHGFDHVPDLKQLDSTASRHTSDLSDPDAPVHISILDDDTSSSSSGESLSDAETVSVISGGEGKRSKHKSRKHHKRGSNGSKASNPRRSRTISRSRSNSRSPSPSRSRSRSRSSSGSERPQFRVMVPAPPWKGLPPGMVARPPVAPMAGCPRPPAPHARPPPPHFPSPQSMGVTFNAANLHLGPQAWYDMVLNIRWANHGEYQTLERQEASKNRIQARALACVRSNKHVWTNVPDDVWATNGISTPGYPTGVPLIPMVVRATQVVIDGVSINLRNAADGFGKLIADAKGLPRVELEVTTTPGFGPRRMAPAMRSV